jgi:hypothetical protein
MILIQEKEEVLGGTKDRLVLEEQRMKARSKRANETK